VIYVLVAQYIERPCDDGAKELSGLMRKKVGLTARELDKRTDLLGNLVCLYAELVRVIIGVGQLFESEAKLLAEPHYVRLFESNQRAVGALELVKHRSDIGRVARCLGKIAKLPAPIIEDPPS
jgi:hypothetical protein